MTNLLNASMINGRNLILTESGINMHTEKLSISLPNVLFNFIDEYQNMHACKSRSEVVQEALKLLQQKELEHLYREASQEIDPAFDNIVNDGLDNDETW